MMKLSGRVVAGLFFDVPAKMPREIGEIFRWPDRDGQPVFASLADGRLELGFKSGHARLPDRKEGNRGSREGD